jgi:two-component system, OmpR family, sensor kinase
MSSGASGPGRSIAWPILALAIASVAVANIFLFAITFSGPPVHDAARGAETLAMALTSGKQPGRPWTRARPRLKIYDALQLPALVPDLKPDPEAARHVADALHVPAPDVHAWVDPHSPRFGDAFFGRFVFAWHRPGGWRIVENPGPPVFTHWHMMTLLAMLGAITALAVPAWTLARTISRPLRRLAAAAEGAQVGAPLVGVPERGAREVRALAGAVTAMHARLGEEARARTRMLAAISHDLGTPLARLAFWVERLPDDARARALADIEEMRSMIGAVLSFTRDEAAAAPATRVDLASLLDSIAEDRQAVGEMVVVSPGPAAVLRGDPSALRRLFGNLVDNAVRYGKRADIGWTLGEGGAEVTIADHGPGIDPGDAERLFEPFVRGDPSRNRETGGTGLGLAIVRSIAVAHGGSVRLANREVDGAIATVRLPAEAATRRNSLTRG